MLPFDKLGGPKRLTNGWAISGITRFATGLPVTIVETDDQSLLGTAFGGPITLPVDTPNLIGPVVKENPRNTGGQYFSISSFGPSALGKEGNSRRRFFHGPGINNWDIALLKDTTITERFDLQFRAEFFNIFNHAQFLTPSGITGFTSQRRASRLASGSDPTTKLPDSAAQIKHLLSLIRRAALLSSQAAPPTAGTVGILPDSIAVLHFKGSHAMGILRKVFIFGQTGVFWLAYLGIMDGSQQKVLSTRLSHQLSQIQLGAIQRRCGNGIPHCVVHR